MRSNVRQFKQGCVTGEISAYIDGELRPDEELGVERHIARCADCAAELNLQKSLLRALDISMEASSLPEIPENFTRTVVTNAESRVAGLRCVTEAKLALILLALLSSIAAAAVGTEAAAALSAAGMMADKFMAIAAFAGHLLMNIALVLGVVARSLSAQLVSGSGAAMFIFILATGILLTGISRLMIRGDRA